MTPAHDHGYHRVPVARVVAETAEAASFVLDVPDELREAFRYRPGQFCTFKVDVDGRELYRCYSMSSAPQVDDELQVTVKRVAGGAVSNWLIDRVTPGSELEVSRPAGVFVLDAAETEFVGFAAGSGITPVFSLMKQVLHESSRPVRLFYANRDPESVIFRDELDRLEAAFGDRLAVTHHFDVDRGFVDADEVGGFLAAGQAAGYYLCGPTPFMDIVEKALLSAGVSSDRIHLERFTAADDAAPMPVAEPDGCQVTIDLDGLVKSVEHRAGSTILQTARQLDMNPPFSCESGNCATCMGRLLEGAVEMKVNNALEADEVADGFILTCQAVPTSATVSVRYGFD